MQDILHDTTKPYKEVEYDGIEYIPCHNYDYISRYRRLRQVIHYTENQTDRFITNETQNSYDYENIAVEYYTVPVEYENRLDLVSHKFFNTPSYNWVIAYLNGISDGYTIREGQVLMIPSSLTELFKSGCILAAVPATSLNLGTE